MWARFIRALGKELAFWVPGKLLSRHLTLLLDVWLRLETLRDGFGGIFYSTCWDIIKMDLTAAVQAFFRGCCLPKTWSSTLIVAIPKGSNPTNFGDLRPISLCNYCAKVISKVLADRMALILPCIISPEQSGFVKGRNITENILLAQEMLQRIDSKVRGSNVMLKLDMAKAYDRMSWLFLLHTLRKFGFDERFLTAGILLLLMVNLRVFPDLLGR